MEGSNPDLRNNVEKFTPLFVSFFSAPICGSLAKSIYNTRHKGSLLKPGDEKMRLFTIGYRLFYEMHGWGQRGILSGHGLVQYFPIIFLIVLFSQTALAAPVTLVPPDLNPGDTYHLIFVTSQTHDSLSLNIADYDDFVQAVANTAGGGLEAIRWMVIGSTPTVNAIDHIGVAGPVYRLDGVRIANDLNDLFDDSLAASPNVNELGNPPATPYRVVTGTNSNGIASVNSLGTANVRIGTPFSNIGTWLSMGTVPGNFSEKFYAISELLQVPLPAIPLSCEGFASPMDNGLVMVKKNRVLPLKAALLNGAVHVTDLDIVAPPVIQVTYSPAIGDAIDVTEYALSAGEGTEGNQFEFDGMLWHFNLKTTNYTAPGTYTITVAAGDSSEYIISPTCLGKFVIQ
jgi:hypothetical protein